jgi:hypothetical protein
MRIIGKKSKETISDRLIARVTVFSNYLYFTKSAMAEYGIEFGDRIKFVSEPPFYGLYVTKDVDGYKVSAQSDKGGGAIKSRFLVKFFRQEFKQEKNGFSFLLSGTKNEIAGSPIVQIKTNNCYTYKSKKNVTANIS